MRRREETYCRRTLAAWNGKLVAPGFRKSAEIETTLLALILLTFATFSKSVAFEYVATWAEVTMDVM